MTGLVGEGECQAILVEVDSATGSFKTHLVGNSRDTLEEALDCLHYEITKVVYGKLSEGLGEDAPIEAGQNTIEGVLQW